MPAVSHNWSFIRLRDEGDEGERCRRSAMCTILEENSTPIVWLERTRPVSERERVLVGGVDGGGEARGEEMGVRLHSDFTKRWRRQDL